MVLGGTEMDASIEVLGDVGVSMELLVGMIVLTCFEYEMGVSIGMHLVVMVLFMGELLERGVLDGRG